MTITIANALVQLPWICNTSRSHTLPIRSFPSMMPCRFQGNLLRKSICLSNDFIWKEKQEFFLQQISSIKYPSEIKVLEDLMPVLVQQPNSALQSFSRVFHTRVDCFDRDWLLQNSLVTKHLVHPITTESNYERFHCQSICPTWMEVSIAETSYVGDQRFWRISRQMPPSA